MYFTILKDMKLPFLSKPFDIFCENDMKDGFYTEKLTVNGVTGTTYYEEIKLRESKHKCFNSKQHAYT